MGRDGCIGLRPVLMGLNLIFACLIAAFGAQLSGTYKMDSFFATKFTNMQCRLNNFAFIWTLVCGSFGIVSTLGYFCWRFSLRREALSCNDNSPKNSQIVAKSWMLAVLHVVAVIVNIVPIWSMKVAPNGVSTAIPSFGPSDSHTTSVHTTSVNTTTANPIDTCNCFEYIQNFVAECTKYGDATFDCDFKAPGFWVASLVFVILSLSTHALALLLWIYAFVTRGKPVTDQHTDLLTTASLNDVPMADATPIPVAHATPIPTADAIPIAATTPADSYGGHFPTATATATTPATASNPALDKSSAFGNF